LQPETIEPSSSSRAAPTAKCEYGECAFFRAALAAANNRFQSSAMSDILPHRSRLQELSVTCYVDIE